MEEAKGRPPGLRFDKNERPFWRATKAACKAGYPVKNVDLSNLASDPRLLRERCERLQREMAEWLTNGGKRRGIAFDGTFGTLLDIYQSDPKSTYFELKPTTQAPYNTYIGMLKTEIGRCRLDRTDGVEVKDWFNSWAEPETKGAPRQLAKAHMAIAVMKAALRFGIMRRLPGCPEFRAVLYALNGKLDRPKSRKIAMAAVQIAAAREAATALQHPRAAFAYATAFEGSVRIWDVIGQWVPLRDKRPSAVIFGKKKWIGPTWANVDENLILRWTPTKTEDTSEATVVIDLRACPMVLEELEFIPVEARKGPLIVNHETGRPYTGVRWAEIWKDVKKAVPAIPAKAWSRDIRKSGSTEAFAGGASTDDVKKVMGHTPETEVTEKVYDLAKVEAFRRVAQSRKVAREKKQ